MPQLSQMDITPKPIRVLVLELVKEGIATHTREIILHVRNIRKNVKEHSIRARLSESVLKKELIRLEEGVYDLIIAHSPYFNIIRYSDHPDDLSNCHDYSEF